MVITERQAAKKKLMAATSMLLVACIMLISATYAWFTLSTAPEITGITTAVGANGNLEIALADTTTWADPDSKVSSAVGTSMSSKVATEANITWGNLVDLSDASYGLSGVTLLPSALNLTPGSGEAGYMLDASPLATPSYGADGRVSELVAQTAFAQYQQTSKQYTMVSETDTTQKGVRVIGAASGMSDRQLYYRNAKLNLSSAISQAKISAKASLEDNGEALANMVIKYGLDKSTTFTENDVTVVKNMVSSLTDAQEKMVTAWENAVIAYAASRAGSALDDTAYLKIAAAIQNGDYSVSGKTLTVASQTVPMPEEFATYYDNIQAIKTEINASKNKLAALDEKDSVTWTELSGALYNLVDTNKLTVCGIPAEGISNKIDDVVSAYTSSGKLTVEVPSKSGVYADIADFCGDYSASVTIAEVKYGDKISLKNIPAIMTTDSSVSPSYFAKATTVITNAGAPGEGGSSSGTISDFYGYALDFYTRTNAANSNLLLQVDEAQRVYSDNNNATTQGGGSNMEFTVDADNYTAEQMVELMGAIRVVFTDGDGNILAMAKLDLSDYTKEDATLSNTIKADLKLCDYTITATKSEDGKTTTVSYDIGAFKSSQVITSLSQNTAKKITAMVYLDGNKVDNSMVANGQTSMTGKMNLQFASDANLVPMEDSGLREISTTATSATK